MSNFCIKIIKMKNKILTKNNRMKILQLVLLIGIAHAYNNIRNRHRLTKEALLHPSMAPWQRLLNFGNDSSFLEILGFSKASFRYLSELIYTQ